MEMTSGQISALDRMRDFAFQRDDITFLLEGGAGVGKTWLMAQFIKSLQDNGDRLKIVVAAPTHKACRVIRGKLSAQGVRWVFKPRGEVPYSHVVVDTTAALLGVRPVIVDDQTEEEQVFASTGDGSLRKLNPDLLVIDEVSMVSQDDLYMIGEAATFGQIRVIAVGDRGQLPPVKKRPLDFDNDFHQYSSLTEIVRQEADSAIIKMAWAIRDGEDWKGVSGKGVRRVDDVGGEFLKQVAVPDDDEALRSVFIAYRNKVVNEIQDLACKKLYGHGRLDFCEGELVLSGMAGYKVVDTMRGPRFDQVVAVADQLRIVEFYPDMREEVYGTPVLLQRVDLPEGAPNREFETYYLSESELMDRNHPFNKEKTRLLIQAKELQANLKRARADRNATEYQKDMLDRDRRRAWSEYFAHQKRIISFSHPFAITSHKSQGSTYKDVYADTEDLEQFNPKALYVAVTRPKEMLTIPS